MYAGVNILYPSARRSSLYIHTSRDKESDRPVLSFRAQIIMQKTNSANSANSVGKFCAIILRYNSAL